MLFAVLASLFLLTLLFCGWWGRNRYFILRSQPTGVIKEKIIYLPLGKIHYPKLRHEIKIFNRLGLVMPTVAGVATLYATEMGALLQDPKHQPADDAYTKLFYGYACEVILSKTQNEIVQRQLRKNLLFLLAPKRKIVKNIKPIWISKNYVLYPTPIYKIFNHSYLDLATPTFTTAEPLQRTVLGSYLKYQNANLTVRQFENFYELFTPREQRLVFHIANDKTNYDCTIARGVFTCKNLLTGQSRSYAVRGDKIRLTTSMCEKTDALRLYLNFQGKATVSVDHAARRLLSSAELAFNQRVENLVTQAYQAKYIYGEKLRQRYQAAEQCVPSLRLLTKVVELTQAADFFQVWDDLTAYQKAAQLFNGFNLVFLYSGANKFVADLVAGFTNQAQMQELRHDNLFVFFVDRTTAEPDAIYFFTKLTKGSHYVAPAPILHKESISKTYPYRRTITLANKTAKPLTFTAQIPINFASPSVVTAQGQILTAVGLYSGKITTYKLPVPFNLENEFLTTCVNLPIKVSLAGFQQKVYCLQRNEQQASYQERKKNFIASLENIVITTQDKKLNQVFAKPVVDGENLALLNLVKAATKNVDKKLLISLLEDKHNLTFDVWQYLLTKIVGIRLLRGKVHLVPCANLMGDFVVEFNSGGEKYTFNTKKCLPAPTSNATILYG